MPIVLMTSFDSGAQIFNGPQTVVTSNNGRGSTGALNVNGVPGNYGYASWVYWTLPDPHHTVTIGAAVYVPSSGLYSNTWDTDRWPFFIFWNRNVGSYFAFGYANGYFGCHTSDRYLWSPSTYNSSGFYQSPIAVPRGQWFYLEATVQRGSNSLTFRVNEQSTTVSLGYNIDEYNNQGLPWQYVGFGGMPFADGSTMRYDDVVIQTGAPTLLGDVTIESVPPTANGSSSQLKGSDFDSVNNYLLVDDPTIDITDYVTGTGRDSYATFVPQHNAGTVMAVGAQVYGQATDTPSNKTIRADLTTHGQVYGDNATIVGDDFNRADGWLDGSATSIGARTWNRLTTGYYAGSAQGLHITSNMLESWQWNQEQGYVVECNEADGIVKLVVTGGGASSGVYGMITLLARYDPTTQTILRGEWNANTGTFSINEWHGTANPVQFQLATAGGTLAIGDTYSMEFTGGTVVLKRNGSVLCSTPNSLYATATQHGVAMRQVTNDFSHNYKIDNWAFTRPTSLFTPGTGLGSTGLFYPTNPYTGQRWTFAEIAAMETGVALA